MATKAGRMHLTKRLRWWYLKLRFRLAVRQHRKATKRVERALARISKGNAKDPLAAMYINALHPSERDMAHKIRANAWESVTTDITYLFVNTCDWKSPS